MNGLSHERYRLAWVYVIRCTHFKLVLTELLHEASKLLIEASHDGGGH